MGRFAVIDTETNWANQVMSIGIVVADSHSFCALDARYYVLTPEYEIGGMFEHTLFSDPRRHPVICSREDALGEISGWLVRQDVQSIFAYNASFDRNHLPEMRHLKWYDIMRLAAYRQYNHKIPADSAFCATGRLKRGYGVEAMLQLLSNDFGYQETHNALWDAMDELKIMQLLGYSISDYILL